MTDEIVFYHNPRSRSQMAHWMLEEVGAPYRIAPVSFDKNEHKSPAFLALNPMGKLPTIVHRGTVVTETAAIIAYLADAFPKAGLAPAPDDPSRGAYYRWLFFAAGPVEASVTAKSLGLLAPADKKTMAGYGSFEETIDALESALAPGPYICGDQFTAADVYVGAQIGWGMMFGTIEKRPAFEAYFARLQARPAAIRANELDEALMPQKEEV
jgi:glutathione S-transferase